MKAEYADISVKVLRVFRSVKTREQHQAALRYMELAKTSITDLHSSRRYSRNLREGYRCMYHLGIIKAGDVIFSEKYRDDADE